LSIGGDSRIRSLFAAGSVFALGACFGQVSAPVIGLLANSEGTQISPVQGVLGASSVGAPIALLGGGRGYLAPGGGWALVRQGDGAVGLLTFSGLTPGNVQTVAGALTSPDLVSFSPTGKSAALFSRNAGVVQVLTALDTTPQVAYQFSTSGMLNPQLFGISDNSAMALVLEENGRVDLVSSGGNVQTVYTGNLNTGIAFLPNQGTAALVDGGAGTLSLLTGLNAVPQVQQIGEHLPSSGGPVLVQTSQDGRYAFAVFESSSSAYRIDLTSGQTSSVAINGVANRLDRLGTGDSFLVSAEPANSAWFLIGAAANLEVVFASVAPVPAVCDAGRGACE
jgi:DNA-binding beta-propeller fold protein YncE